MIRPRPARWFEVLVARDDATVALEALAATGAVELEAGRCAGPSASVAELRPQLAQFDDLARAYGSHWPHTSIVSAAFAGPPASVLERDIARIRAWAAEAGPALAESRAIASERADLRFWQDALEGRDAGSLPLSGLRGDGTVRSADLIMFPDGELPAAPPHTLMRPLDTANERPVLVIGPPEEIAALAERAAPGARRHALPEWLDGGVQASLAWIADRLPWLDAREAALRATLDELAERHALGKAIADATRLAWIDDNAHAVASGEHFCVIAGWTSERSGARLVAALDAAGARSILHFPPPPGDVRAPLLFANPVWARPFEVFAKALGMPSRNEVDPAVLLAVTVPLLFGYMFADVGQGLVIAAVGFALRDRFAVARLFIAGGISAALFGVVFGSVFSLHLLDPLWVAPLEHPLEVLVVPVFGGAALLAFGLLLSGLEAHWRGELGDWLAGEGALAGVYGGLVVGVVWAPAFWIAAAAAVASCAGQAVRAGRFRVAAAAAGELVERAMQLLINTLSFARVGAFALAHAGLSSAIVALMDATSSAFAKGAVLVAGNVIVIVLETLVVSIQTTRLVLFEFFTRFLRATGRSFRPAPLPPVTT